MEIDRRGLKDRARELLPTLIEWRRAFHRWPELGFKEVKTAGRIEAILRGMGLEVTTGLAGTGVVGLLHGARAGKIVALRADMDALPIREATGLPFASENEGVMHACGHDAHMTAVLGACSLLAERRHEWAGSVKFIFQPAEEMLGGGRALCEAGVLDDPDVAAIFGMHVWPWLPKGRVAVIEGPAMAAFDEFEVEIFGRSSHGASPHLGVDSIVVAARVIDALQHVVAREIDPQDPAVLTVGKIHGGSATNIIAERTVFSGGVRSFDPALRSSLPERIERVVAGVAQAHGATYGFTWSHGYPALVNERTSVELYSRAISKVLGDGALHTGMRPSMASEDFAYYLERRPGAYAFFGIGEEGGSPGLHTPQFVFDEAILPDAAALLAGVALEALEAPA